MYSLTFSNMFYYSGLWACCTATAWSAHSFATGQRHF